MDIAAALGAAPQVATKQEPAPTAPALPDSEAAGGDSFAEEFANSAPAEGTAPDEAEAPLTPEEVIAADNELLIEIEDLTVSEETSVAETDQEQSTPVATDTAVIAAETEVAPETEAPTAGGETENVELSALPVATTTVEHIIPAEIADTPAAEIASETLGADAEAAADLGAEPQVVADADAAAAPIVTPAVETSATITASLAGEVASSFGEDAMVDGPTEEDGIEQEAPPTREAREKPWLGGQTSDRLHNRWASWREAAPEMAAVTASRAAAFDMSQAAATTKPDGVGVSRAESVDVASQVTAAIRADRGAGSIDVRLDPPELGRVRIQFNLERTDAVVATVSSERGETLDLLRRHAADLVRELERAGFTNVQLDFAGAGGQEFDGSAEAMSFTDAGFEPMADEKIIAFVRKPTGRLDRFV